MSHGTNSVVRKIGGTWRKVLKKYKTGRGSKKD